MMGSCVMSSGSICIVVGAAGCCCVLGLVLLGFALVSFSLVSLSLVCWLSDAVHELHRYVLCGLGLWHVGHVCERQAVG